jgi:hypothetical protein
LLIGLSRIALSIPSPSSIVVASQVVRNHQMSTTTDPVVDESVGGGEVVFSSDGLAPVLLIKPPPVEQNAVVFGDKETVLDAGDDLPVAHAFEVFSGKVYSVKTTTSAAAAPLTNSREGPLQRLARLQTEVSELEAELRTTSSNSGRAFDEEVVQLASQLKSRLYTAAGTRQTGQDELTRLIRSQLKEAASKSSSKEAATATTSAGIVYELYGGAAQNPTTTTDERLIQVERLLGSSSQSHKSLLARLEELEQMVQHVDTKMLDQAATKAKVIRADLEAASKARTKLTATYKKEDSKTIQQLHAQMTELEGLSQHLPALGHRLQQLALLHVQSASFATRLSHGETQAASVEASLAQLEQAVGMLQSQLVENVKIVETNMKKLDERLDQL